MMHLGFSKTWLVVSDNRNLFSKFPIISLSLCKSCYFRRWLATLCLVISFPLKLATRRGVARAPHSWAWALYSLSFSLSLSLSLSLDLSLSLSLTLSLSFSICLSRYIPKWSKEGKFSLTIVMVKKLKLSSTNS